MENTQVKIEKVAEPKAKIAKKTVPKKAVKTNDSTKLAQLEKARIKLKELRTAAAAKGEKYISKRRAKAKTATELVCGSENY
jgi:hypothetical protein